MTTALTALLTLLQWTIQPRREIFEIFQKYFTTYFVKYFTPKNFVKFYITTSATLAKPIAPELSLYQCAYIHCTHWRVLHSVHTTGDDHACVTSLWTRPCASDSPHTIRTRTQYVTAHVGLHGQEALGSTGCLQQSKTAKGKRRWTKGKKRQLTVNCAGPDCDWLLPHVAIENPNSYNKYERYYRPGRRPLAYLLTLVYAYSKPQLCISIHHYAPPIGSTAQRAPRIELQPHWLQQAAAMLMKVQCQVLNR